LGIWFFFISRNAYLGALTLYARDSVTRGWQTSFLDKVLAITIGLLWLAVVIVVEVYFRRGVQKQDLLRRFVKVVGIEFLTIFVADVFLLWVQGGSTAWLRWVILGGEVVVGVLLLLYARFLWRSTPGRPDPTKLA
jgi:hypothetical protein